MLAVFRDFCCPVRFRWLAKLLSAIETTLIDARSVRLDSFPNHQRIVCLQIFERLSGGVNLIVELGAGKAD